MSFKENLKNILDAIKYQSGAQKQIQQNRRSISIICLTLSIIAAIMSCMNFFKHQYGMLAATTILTLVLVFTFILSCKVNLRRIVDLMLCTVPSMLCLYFALTGGNNGFAILWILLLPLCTMLLLEFIYGICVGIFFEIFVIVLFWTPLKNTVITYYSQTFMLRFPMLYTAFFVTSFFTKYFSTKQEMAEYKYLQTIEHLSMIDKLTNIPNRRNFEERLRQEWNRAIRNKEPISILIVDVDNFKNYNDTYGHLQGDTALQSIASALAKALKRTEDFVARWGGEEFIILLSNMEGSKAFDMAERIRLQVADTQIPLANGQITHITISTGVNSQIPLLNSSIDDFIRYADDALYAAKHDGRNKVRVYHKE